MIDSQRWHTMDRIFAASLDLPTAERAAYLDAACAGDAALRGEVERLLLADAEVSAFLEGPIGGGLLGNALADHEEGGRLGPYRLVRRIGGGGMGTVYLARREDDQYQRDVAIKILRSGLASSGAFHRFLAERQILARLEHPDIARLYDGGRTEDGRPYLVMELIEGTPVDQYCDRHRLTVDQRLDLFRRICSAVQYAHQNLLVHRDLKPGNILVNTEGEPKLLDFGIAKRLEGESADPQTTRTGLRLLTPSYASPEQVRGGPITTASDVYSLGVLLYELLAGRSPHQTSGASYEIEQAICEKEPERPSAALFRPGPPSAEEIAQARDTRSRSLRRRLQGDLDNIVLTALRKEPRRRYASVEHLARDLELHLQDLPVTARPDTLRYRARKFLRRRRGAVAAAVLAAIVAGGFVTSVVAQGRRIARERDKSRYTLSFLVDTFKQTDPYRTQGEPLTANQILDRGAERVSRELADQPDVQAAVMDAIGEVDRGLGRYAEAAPLLARALALRRKIFGPESLEVAESLEHLGQLAADRLDLPAAEKLLRRSLAIRRRLLGDDDVLVAKTINNLADVLLLKGTPPAEVEKLERQALESARAAEGRVGATVAESILQLARARQAAGDFPQAERLFREGLSIERQALKEGDPRLARHQTVLGEILIDMGKAKEAEAVLRDSLRAQREIFGNDHPDIAATLGNLAMAVYEQDRYAEAEALNREVLAFVRSHYGPSHWMVPMVLGNLAVALQSQHKEPEAIPVLEEALEVRRRTLGAEHPLVAQALLLLAGSHRQLGQYPEALSQAREALGILEKAEGPDHPHVAYPMREIGRIYLAQKLYREAEPYLRRSLEIRRRELPADHPEVARAKVSLAECLLGTGRAAEVAEAAVLLRGADAATPLAGGEGSKEARKARELLAKAERLQRRAPSTVAPASN